MPWIPSRRPRESSRRPIGLWWRSWRWNSTDRLCVNLEKEEISDMHKHLYSAFFISDTLYGEIKLSTYIFWRHSTNFTIFRECESGVRFLDLSIGFSLSKSKRKRRKFWLVWIMIRGIKWDVNFSYVSFFSLLWTNMGIKLWSVSGLRSSVPIHYFVVVFVLKVFLASKYPK